MLLESTSHGHKRTVWQIVAISRADVGDSVAVFSLKWVCIKENGECFSEAESFMNVSPPTGHSSLIGNWAVWTLFEPAKNRNMTNCFISFVCFELWHLFAFYFSGFSDARPWSAHIFLLSWWCDWHCCLNAWLWSFKALMLRWGGATGGRKITKTVTGIKCHLWSKNNKNLRNNQV